MYLGRVRWLFFVFWLGAVGAIAYSFYQYRQLEYAYVPRERLPQYHRISANDLEEVMVPRNLGIAFISDPGQLVGHYTTEAVVAGAPLVAGMVVREMPDGRRLFEGGLLPENTEAVMIDLPGNAASQMKPSDLINLYAFVAEGGAPFCLESGYAYLVAQKIRMLEHVGGTSYLVALTPEQVAVYTNLLQSRPAREADLSFLASITQAANEDKPTLSSYELSPSQPEQLEAVFGRWTPVAPAGGEQP
jgi:hypothetical protein